MSTVDKKIDWEKFIEENCGFDESVIDWKTLNGQYNSEKDETRARILDLILWKGSQVDSLHSAKKTFKKYKDVEDTQKAFEYIFKKLSKQVHYIPEAQEAMEKINEQAMLAYERVLNLCIARDETALKNLQRDLENYDNGNYFQVGDTVQNKQTGFTAKIVRVTDKNYMFVNDIYIFDNEDSFTYTYRHAENDLSMPYELEPVNPFDLDPQKTMVVSGRVGADVAGIIKSNSLTLDLVGEFAYSSDDVYTHVDVPVMDPADPTGATPLLDPESGEQVFEDVASKETLNGTALLVNMNVGYKVSDLNLNLAVDFIRNDSNWFNNLAQSPQFFAQRILNTDKDGNTIRYGVNSPLYSSFDALYNFSPKYSPAATSLATDDGGLRDGQTESYNIAPFNKNSWGTTIYTRNQLALLETMTDPALQMSLPNGLATSNRMGAQGLLTAKWGEAAEVQGLFSMFNQVSPLVGFKEAAYTEYGGGAKVDVFKLLGFKKPLEISGSYKHSERSMDTDNWVSLGMVDGTAELKSDFINAGLYVQYLPRLGVTAGFQYITTEYNDFQGVVSTLKAPMLTGKQMQWMVGLDYSFAPNAWFSLNYGMISVENEYNTAGLVAAASADGAYNLPDYYDVTTDATGKYTHEFTQSIIEASINVEF